MQLELSNFQHVASNESIKDEVSDPDGAEQLSQPRIEESDQVLASLIRSVGITSITVVENLVSCNQKGTAFEQRWSIMLPLQGPLRHPLRSSLTP
jgi:hypothetical protein